MVFNMVKRFAIMAVAVPLAAAGARKLSERLEAKKGPSRGSRMLREGANFLGGLRGQKKKRRRFAW